MAATKNKRQISISLESDMIERLTKVAESRGSTLAVFLRETIFESLSRRPDLSLVSLPPILSADSTTESKVS